MNRRWEWIILSVRSMTDFEENNVMTVLTKLVWQGLLFLRVYMRFIFFTRSLIDRCQIVTDTCKNNVTKFVRKPCRSPLSLRKLKCFGEAFLFNLYFNYHLPVQKLFSLWTVLPYLQRFQDLCHSFSPYRPPSRQITYMYIVRQKPIWSRGSVKEPIRTISEAKQTS